MVSPFASLVIFIWVTTTACTHTPKTSESLKSASTVSASEQQQIEVNEASPAVLPPSSFGDTSTPEQSKQTSDNLNQDEQMTADPSVEKPLSTAGNRAAENTAIEKINDSRSSSNPPTESADKPALFLKTPRLLPFKIRYESKYRLGWFNLNVTATRTLTQLSQSEWQITFKATSKVASFFESSRFSFIDGKISPIEYRSNSSGLIDGDRLNLLFDESAQTITDGDRGIVYNDSWQPGLHDNLTYTLQAGLDIDNDDDLLQYHVFQKNKTKLFRFKKHEQTKIKVGQQTYPALELRQIRKPDRKVSVFYALTESAPLVQLVDIKNGKLRYRINATAIENIE